MFYRCVATPPLFEVTTVKEFAQLERVVGITYPQYFQKKH